MTEQFRRKRAIEPRPLKDTIFHPHTPMGAGEEFDIVRRMLERWGPQARRIGDDAAVITTLGERAVVASTDTSVENVHFRRDWLSPQEIGYRATAAALSDMAAMAAKPVGILAALAVPEAWRADMDALSDGIGEAAAYANAPIIGGDLSAGTELSLTITVIGTARDPLFRTGARLGDLVFVTGQLGGPGAALASLSAGNSASPAAHERFRRPEPRILEAGWLAEKGATAAIDVSDGLAADLMHVASASRVGIVIDLARVPVIDGVDPLDALTSGEEYELVVTGPPALAKGFAALFKLPLSEIGRVERGPAKLTILSNGEAVDVPAGYSHFQPR